MILTSQTTQIFDPTWQGFGGVHGGLLLGTLADAAAARLSEHRSEERARSGANPRPAPMGTAAARLSEHRSEERARSGANPRPTPMGTASAVLGGRPAAITAHFNAPVRPGPVDIDVDVLHAGRSGSARAEIAGSVTALVRTHNGGSGGDLHWPRETAAIPNSVPETLPRVPPMVDLVSFAQHLDVRPTDGRLPLDGGATPEFAAWLRLVDAPEFSVETRSAILLDALPPGLYGIATHPVPVPTIEMTAHFVPHTDAGPWHFIRHRTVWASSDLAVDETELYTATGELAAQARQLRRIVGKVNR